jgi:hypothetical protein
MPGPSFCVPTGNGPGRGTAKPDRARFKPTSPRRILATGGEPAERHQGQGQGDHLRQAVLVNLGHHPTLRLIRVIRELAHTPEATDCERGCRDHSYRQKQPLEPALVAICHRASGRWPADAHGDQVTSIG